MSSNSGYKPHQIQAALYLFLGLALGLLAFKVYFGGFYQAILLPSMLAPIFITLGITRLQTSNRFKYDPAAILTLSCLAIFIVLQPDTHPTNFSWYWAGLFYPVLAFLLLPNCLSLFFSLLLLSSILWLHLLNKNLSEQIEFSAHYLLIVFIAWLYNLNVQIKTQRLLQAVGIDKCTGFFNHQQFQKHLSLEIDRAQATERPLSILLVELHQYPEMLKEFGKQPAQEFLEDASHICRLNCRIGDSAYRYDQQTFLLLMPNTTINGALVLRTRLYQHLLQDVFCDAGPLDLTITPITLQENETYSAFKQRLADSCYHSLNARVKATLN